MPKDERLIYESPRAVRLDDSCPSTGACGEPGSGDADCGPAGNSASPNCMAPGSGAASLCASYGSSATSCTYTGSAPV
ncbi:MAG: hypothetical protein FJ026_01760 [Chloroflexi bacterium]|nr:hypothetical protein [Chloroflexota bacterium]